MKVWLRITQFYLSENDVWLTKHVPVAFTGFEQ